MKVDLAYPWHCGTGAATVHMMGDPSTTTVIRHDLEAVQYVFQGATHSGCIVASCRVLVAQTAQAWCTIVTVPTRKTNSGFALSYCTTKTYSGVPRYFLKSPPRREFPALAKTNQSPQHAQHVHHIFPPQKKTPLLRIATRFIPWRSTQPLATSTSSPSHVLPPLPRQSGDIAGLAAVGQGAARPSPRG